MDTGQAIAPDVALLSMADAGRILAVGRSQLYQMIGRGQIVGVRIGRRRLVTRASVDAYVARLVDAS